MDKDSGYLGSSAAGSGSGGSSSSSCWRRRSYDHDSDYLRYQKQRVSSRPSVTDYISSGVSGGGGSSGVDRSSSIIGPGSAGGLTSSAGGGSSAGLRSRSRSRVSDYDPYRRSVEPDVGHIGSSGVSGGSHFTTSSYGQPGSGGSHYYSHYCGPRVGDAEDHQSVRHPRPPDYSQMASLEVSARTRRYHPVDKC
jgi:hypothetical protein